MAASSTGKESSSAGSQGLQPQPIGSTGATEFLANIPGILNSHVIIDSADLNGAVIDASRQNYFPVSLIENSEFIDSSQIVYHPDQAFIEPPPIEQDQSQQEETDDLYQLQQQRLLDQQHLLAHLLQRKLQPQSPLLQTMIGREFLQATNPEQLLQQTVAENTPDEFRNTGASGGSHPSIEEQLHQIVQRVPSEESNVRFIDSSELPKFVHALGMTSSVPVSSTGTIPDNIHELQYIDEPSFGVGESVAEYVDTLNLKPAAKDFSSYNYQSKFFPEGGYDISSFFHGFPAFGYFHRDLDKSSSYA